MKVRMKTLLREPIVYLFCWLVCHSIYFIFVEGEAPKHYCIYFRRSV